MADAVTLSIPDARAERRAAQAERRAESRARDHERGYTISTKRLILAFTIEGIIVATSLVGAWLFATMYWAGDSTAFWMMMLAPVAYGVIEFSRVPLAVSIRTHNSMTLRVIATIGVIGAAAVTVKSISQLGEIMFRPRLTEVVRAQEAYNDAQNKAANIDRRIAEADAVVAQRTSQLAEAERRLKDGNTELGALPPQKCFKTSTTTPDGRRVTGTRCTTDPRTEAMKSSLTGAAQDRRDASERLDKARAERATLDRTATDAGLNAAQVTFRDAVLRSQLHSFTAMAFFKDPGQVTDKEIHSFLFFFVFIPAIGASLAATLLALTSIETVREEDDIVLDERAGSFILEPFAEEIVQQARAEAEAAARAALSRSRTEPDEAEPVTPPAAVTTPGAPPLRVVETGR